MKAHTVPFLAAAILLGVGRADLAGAATSDRTEVAAVYAEVFNGYKRTPVDAHSFKPETFAFGEGERFDLAVANKSEDNLPFRRVIHALADPLAEQNYVAATDPKETNLLIMVYWGTTTGAEDSARTSPGYAVGDLGLMQLDNRQRDHQNVFNARLLGFTDALELAHDMPWLTFTHDAVEELEVNRYFVVLQAFDFQLLWKQHQKKLLWETRFSIREHGNSFGEQLPSMTQQAAQFFGRNSSGLVRRSLRHPDIKMGEPKVIEDPAAK